MSVLCSNVFRLRVPNLELRYVLKNATRQSWYVCLIQSKFALFSVSHFKNEKLIKKERKTYMKTEISKLYSRVFCIFLPKVIEI